MIVDRGRIVALDTPEALIESLGADRRIVFGLPEGQDVASLMRLSAVSRIERTDGCVIVYGHGDRFAGSASGPGNDGYASLELSFTRHTSP